MIIHKVVCLLSLFAVMATHTTVHAVSITDLTASTAVFSDNFEGTAAVSTLPAPDASAAYYPGPAVVGSWRTDVDPSVVNSQVTNATTAPDPGPFEGAQYLRLYRDTPAFDGGTVFALNSSTVTTVGDVVQMRTMVYLPAATDANARGQIILLGDASDPGGAYLTSPAWARGDGAGNVMAVVGDGGGGISGVVPTGLHYATNTWQEWDLTYVVGSSTFSVTVDGVTAGGFSSVKTGGVAGLELANGSSAIAGSVYFDGVRAVPEPSSVALLALGCLGLVIRSRWRR